MLVLTFISYLAFVSAKPQSGYAYNRPGSGIGIENKDGSFLGGVGTGQVGTFSSGSGGSFGGGFRNSLEDGLRGGSGRLVGERTGLVGGGTTSLIQKHIYVHIPPPEQEENRQRINTPVQQSQKHYKIIFIKAPSAPSYQAPVIPVQAQNEEKTLVYVLVKKPEEQPDIVLPTAAPTQPSKPEVYFIKYKTQNSGATNSYSSGRSNNSGAGTSIRGDSAISGESGAGIGGGLNGNGIGGSDVSAQSPLYGPPGKSGPY